ncbi:unnamed protein product [Trichobilharzia regenti]|nr:unnamed protein product [Trichobilharzia regenti]
MELYSTTCGDSNCLTSVQSSMLKPVSQLVTLLHISIAFFGFSFRYVQALADRVTVIFSTIFKDPDDMLIGKVFMQEFTEARRRLDRAPQVLYSHRVPPAELQGTDAVVNDSVAYITFGRLIFILFPFNYTFICLLRQKRTYENHVLCLSLHVSVWIQHRTWHRSAEVRVATFKIAHRGRQEDV